MNRVLNVDHTPDRSWILYNIHIKDHKWSKGL